MSGSISLILAEILSILNSTRSFFKITLSPQASPKNGKRAAPKRIFQVITTGLLFTLAGIIVTAVYI